MQESSSTLKAGEEKQGSGVQVYIWIFAVVIIYSLLMLMFGKNTAKHTVMSVVTPMQSNLTAMGSLVRKNYDTNAELQSQIEAFEALVQQQEATLRNTFAERDAVLQAQIPSLQTALSSPSYEGHEATLVAMDAAGMLGAPPAPEDAPQ